MKKALLSLLLLTGLVYGQTVGKRPYEMDWAGRTEDDHRPLVDFERNDVWTMEATNGEAIAERSREQQMFGAASRSGGFRRHQPVGIRP